MGYEEPFMQLQFADPGWIKIDTAVLRVRGELSDIVLEMDRVLKDDAVHALCANLGISSAGFIFIDPVKQFTRFFDNDSDQQKTYHTEYLWQNTEAKHLWVDTVHRLFVQVREAQGQLQKSEATTENRTEDFFRYLPKDDCVDVYFGEAERNSRLQYTLHYVSLGETLFTMLAWRNLLAAVNFGLGETSLTGLDVPFDAALRLPLACEWNGASLLRMKYADEQNQIVELWHTVCNSTSTLSSVFAALGVSASEGNKQSLERRALVTFIAMLAEQPGTDFVDLPDEQLNLKIQALIPCFLRRLYSGELKEDVLASLHALERYARFPVMPFHVWHVLDGSPKCYMVSPVWTSQQYSVPVDDVPCRHLGLALCAVQPLSKIDWTIPELHGSPPPSWCSEAGPVLVANVIRLMARPLVEQHLYSSAVRELQLRLEDEFTTKTQNVIHRDGELAQ